MWCTHRRTHAQVASVINSYTWQSCSRVVFTFLLWRQAQEDVFIAAGKIDVEFWHLFSFNRTRYWTAFKAPKEWLSYTDREDKATSPALHNLWQNYMPGDTAAIFISRILQVMKTPMFLYWRGFETPAVNKHRHYPVYCMAQAQKPALERHHCSQ